MASVVLERGKMITLSEENLEMALRAGERRHRVNASDTRGAGTNRFFHLKGCVGEMVLLQELGLRRSPEVLQTWSASVDAPEAQPPCESKCGVPLELKTKVHLHVLYVVITPWLPWTNREEAIPRHFRITRMAFGEQILRAQWVPLLGYCPRDGTRDLNWEIPGWIEQISVHVP